MSNQVIEYNSVISLSIIAPETVEKVIRFYNEDFVSRVLPGMNDVISAKENGVRNLKQMRLLY